MFEESKYKKTYLKDTLLIVIQSSSDNSESAARCWGAAGTVPLAGVCVSSTDTRRFLVAKTQAKTTRRSAVDCQVHLNSFLKDLHCIFILNKTLIGGFPTRRCLSIQCGVKP